MARRSTGGTAPRKTLVTNAARKTSTAGGHIQVWHPALTIAAEQGEEYLEEALEAEVEEDGELLYEVNGDASCPHSGSRRTSGRPVAEVPQSPFPPRSSFGIVPYAAWHGHLKVLEAFVEELGADVERTALVPVEPHLQVRVQWDHSERVSMIDTAPARALQIAVWRRDTAMAQRLLQGYGADGHLPFLLDIAPPRAGTLFATKAGEWSKEGHWCFPPAFKAAAPTSTAANGQLRWPFRTEELIGLLLPAMGRSGSLGPWIKRNDRLPGDDGSDDEGGSSSDGE